MILVAVGANLPGPDGCPPRATCDWAIDQLAAIEGLHLVGRSAWIRTPPWPPSDQPDYVNGAVRLEGEVDPHRLLQTLHAIEARAGRTRSQPNAARTLDLDLLAIDGLVIASPGLTLPHPRLHDRAFVLGPLAEIAPGWTHPVLHRTVRELLAHLPRPGA